MNVMYEAEEADVLKTGGVIYRIMAIVILIAGVFIAFSMWSTPRLTVPLQTVVYLVIVVVSSAVGLWLMGVQMTALGRTQMQLRLLEIYLRRQEAELVKKAQGESVNP